MIGIILAIALILRLINLNQSFWLDEAISGLTAKKSLVDLLGGMGVDFQPPLYYIFLHFWMKLGICQEWFLRLPSVLFGVITVWFVYRFVKRIFSEKTALLAALFLATSQYHIHYSQELRMYSLLAMLTVWSIDLFWQKKWFWLAIIYILGIYTNYMFFFVIGGEVMMGVMGDLPPSPRLWWPRRNLGGKNGRMKGVAAAAAAASLGFVPWLPILWQQWQTSRQLITEAPAWSGVSSLPIYRLLPQLFIKFSLGRISFDDKIFYGAVILGIAAVFGTVAHKTYMSYMSYTKTKNGIKFLVCFFAVSLGLVVVFSFWVPVAGVWRLIFLLPVFTILAAVGAEKSRLLIISIILINFAGNFLYWINPRYQREPWREAIKYVEAKSDKESLVIFEFPGELAPWQWYQQKNLSIADLTNFSMVLNNNSEIKKVFVFGYLQDLFDRGKMITRQLENTDWQIKEVKDFPGLGFVYRYENYP